MQELAVPSKCVVFRNGIEIWMPEGEKLTKFQTVLGTLQSHMFINWEGRSMNTADIVGIFSPQDMEDMKRRKNGEWVCKRGEWHRKMQECDCRGPATECQVCGITPCPDREEHLRMMQAKNV